MIAVSSLITQIQAALTTAQLTATVSPVLDFAAIAAADVRDGPLLWVALTRENAELNALNCGVSQRVEVTFSVVFAASGSAALDPVRGCIQTALTGWTPAGAMEPMQYGGGSVADLNFDLLWWEDSFTTAYFIRTV